MAEESGQKGGRVTDINVSKLFSRYSAQIELLERELRLGGVASNMSLTQRLPRHLRRRAASHNPRRVPRSVRDKFADARAKNEANSKKKKPARRYRRKPNNLRAVYTKRQSHIKWLQTHIWHAKRFHIVEKWGWRLPNFSTDKSLKSSIRALKTEAIMTDVSFSSIIELSGTKSSLIDLLNKFVPAALGRPYAQENFWKERRHCSVNLYDPNDVYPCGAIGNCMVVIPTTGETNSGTLSKLWLMAIHPLVLNNLLPLLKSTSPSSIAVDDVSEQLSAIRFFGPRVHVVLSNALSLSEKAVIDCPAGYYLDEVVYDPRPNIPLKVKPIIATEKLSRKAGKNNTNQPSRNRIDAVNQSSLFEAPHRKSANLSRVADHLVSSRYRQKATKLFTAKSGSMEVALTPIPIVIVRSAHWFDVVVPAAWTTAFWVAFVYNGARVGGLRELESLPSEMQSLTGSIQLNYCPDAKNAASVDAVTTESQLFAEYLKRPPAKRANYRKLAIFRPFFCPWQELVTFWRLQVPLSSDQTGFYVLREFMVLRQLSDDVNRKLHISPEITSRFPNALVPVQLSAHHGGTHRFGLMCLPAEEGASPDEPMHEFNSDIIPDESKDAGITFSANSRKIIGLFVVAGYSLVAGEGRAVGFVSLLGLDVLLRCRGTNVVDFRAASERRYWPGKIAVITNPKL